MKRCSNIWDSGTCVTRLSFLSLPGGPIRSPIQDLVPIETKVQKWSQKSPAFAHKSQISDFTFRWCWKGEAHSTKPLLCSIWTYTMYHVHVFDTLCPSNIYWPFDTFWNGKCLDNTCVAFFACFSLTVMKITTKIPRKVQNWSQKSRNFAPKAWILPL